MQLSEAKFWNIKKNWQSEVAMKKKILEEVVDSQ